MGAPEQDGRRRRGEATRLRTIEAALALFAEDGYSATSVGAIAKLAGVGTQSIYHAFGNKEGVLAAAMETAAEQFHADLESAASAQTPEIAVQRMAEVFVQSPQYLRLHLVLILERRNGDAALLERAAALRLKGRSMAQLQLEETFGRFLPAERRAQVIDDLGRLLMMFLDGAFIERQVNDDEAQFRRLFELIAVAMRGALLDALREPTEQA